jgi:hypothetical protein
VRYPASVLTGNAVRLAQSRSTLNEQRVDICVAAGEQRKIAPCPGQARPSLGPIVAFAKSFASGPPAASSSSIIRLRSAARCAIAIAFRRTREPLNLLQLQAVPREIADERIETAR